MAITVIFQLEQKITIFGAGIIGVSIAYNLLMKNQDVTLVEGQSKEGCGVTEKSYAWINPSGCVLNHFQHLYDETLAEYLELDKEIPELKVKWTGALTWGNVSNMKKSHIQKISRQQVLELEPNLKEYPEEATYAFKEGAVDPYVLTNLLVKKAEENGANILFDTKVTRIKKEGAKVFGIHTSKNYIESDVNEFILLTP